MYPEEIYLDHAASAPLHPAAREAVMRALEAGPGNASSAHAAGRRARRLLGDAREAVATLVGARPEQVVFTSGTTESNRLGVRGLLAGSAHRPRRLVTTAAVHDSLRALATALAAEGVAVCSAGVGEAGHVPAADVVRVAGDEPCVIALSLADSVTGALQPVPEVAAALPRALLHVDAAQAVGRVPVRLEEIGAAALSFSAHKLGGPQGIGALVIRDDRELRPTDGDVSQERGRRGGTEAVALAAGFGAAAHIARETLASRRRHHDDALRPLIEFVAATDGAEVVTTPPAVPGIVLVRFVGCPGDAVAAALDASGLRVSTGTACASGARTPPRVLTAAGWRERDAAECVRISTGWTSRTCDAEHLVNALRVVVPRVRAALSGDEKNLP